MVKQPSHPFSYLERSVFRDPFPPVFDYAMGRGKALMTFGRGSAIRQQSSTDSSEPTKYFIDSLVEGCCFESSGEESLREDSEKEQLLHTDWQRPIRPWPDPSRYDTRQVEGAEALRKRKGVASTVELPQKRSVFASAGEGPSQ